MISSRVVRLRRNGRNQPHCTKASSIHLALGRYLPTPGATQSVTEGGRPLQTYRKSFIRATTTTTTTTTATRITIMCHIALRFSAASVEPLAGEIYGGGWSGGQERGDDPGTG